MVTKKDLIIAVLCTFCLTATLFTIIPSMSLPDVGDYDHWIDINDDGKIDGRDLMIVSRAFGSYGTPINKTELLLDLLERVAALENQSILNATKLGEPDYDSFEVYGGWMSIDKGETLALPHSLNTTNLLVYLVGNDTNIDGYGIHQRDYGGERTSVSFWGAYWHELTETSIKVTRQGNDDNWEYIRIMIWIIQEP